MPKRRAPQHYYPPYPPPYAPPQPVITAESRVSLTLWQTIGAIAGLVTVLGPVLAVWLNQSTFKTNIETINTKLDTAVSAASTVSKEQDTKREQMGKDFLASNQKIADTVVELKVQLVKTQSAEEQQNATLTQIRDALGGLSLAAGHPKGR